MAVGEVIHPVEGITAIDLAYAGDGDVEALQSGLALRGADYRAAFAHVHLEQFHRVWAGLTRVGRERLDREHRVPVLQLPELAQYGLREFSLLDEGMPDRSQPYPASGRRYVCRIGDDPRHVARRGLVHAAFDEQTTDDRGKAAGEHLHHLDVGVEFHMTVGAQVLLDGRQLHRSGRGHVECGHAPGPRFQPAQLTLILEIVDDIRLADYALHGCGVHRRFPEEVFVADELHRAGQRPGLGDWGRWLVARRCLASGPERAGRFADG